MSLKGSFTTADYISFEKAADTAKKLLKDPKMVHIGRYIIIAINTGLRNSDIVKLTYDDLQKDIVLIKEKKTDKFKKIAINENIREIIPEDATGDIFLTQKGTNISIQHLNIILKQVFKKESKTLNISSHSLRKSFGRRVYENNNESEKALLYLSELFNHSSLSITKRYLGIRQEELNNIYMNL